MIYRFFFSIQWFPRSYSVYISVSLSRANSQFPADVIDALMLAVKENAHKDKLDSFVHVRRMLKEGKYVFTNNVAVVKTKTLCLTNVKPHKYFYLSFSQMWTLLADLDH